MTKEQIKELEAKVAAAKAQAAEKVENQIAVARLNAQLSTATNEHLINAKARQAMTAATTNKLKELELACETIVNEMPIYNQKTRENRKWNPSRQYGLGNQIALLTGLLSGIQYSAMDHRVQMLALTELDEDTIEQTLEAFGNTAYYSKNHDLIVDEVEYDFEGIQNAVMLLEEHFEITLDKSKLTDRTLRAKFSVARAKAEADKEEAATTAELSQGLIEV